MKYFLLYFYSAFLFGQTGLEVAKMVENRKTPNDQSNTTKMILTNSKGKKRINILKSKSMDSNKKQIMWFLEPKDDKGVAFLKIENQGKDDEMRMWLPAFKKVRRNSSKRKGDSFMGSDLSYEDMSSRKIEEHKYLRLEDEIINNLLCYQLEVIPNEKAQSSYSKHLSWIDQSTLMIIKEESYDKRGELKKTKEFYNSVLKGYSVMERVFVKDVQKNHSTEVTFEGLEVNLGIKETLFQEKNLKSLPKN